MLALAVGTGFRGIVDACGVVLRKAGFERQPTQRFVRDSDDGLVQLVEFQRRAGLFTTNPRRFAGVLRRHGLALFARLGTRAAILANAGRYELDHWVDTALRRRARDEMVDDPDAEDARRALDRAIVRCATRRGFHGFAEVTPSLCAIILAKQGKAHAARADLLRRQRATDHRGHARQLAELAIALGLRPLATGARRKVGGHCQRRRRAASTGAAAPYADR